MNGTVGGAGEPEYWANHRSTCFPEKVISGPIADIVGNQSFGFEVEAGAGIVRVKDLVFFYRRVLLYG